MYTNKSIRLHSRCLEYLKLIQKANNRAEEKRSLLARYDAKFPNIILMYKRREIEDRFARWAELAEWLINRYEVVMSELIAETSKRIHPLSIAS